MCIQIANAERLALEAAARVFEPPPEVDYVEWAKDNIVFIERESPFPGPFNVERFSHVAPILGALSPEDSCRIRKVRAAASKTFRDKAAELRPIIDSELPDAE